MSESDSDPRLEAVTLAVAKALYEAGGLRLSKGWAEEVAKAALAAADEVMWQPIEGRHKDGSDWLLSAPGQAVWRGSWVSQRPPGEPEYRWNEYGPRWQRTGFVDVDWHPTHARPLPAPPTGRSEG